MNSININNNVNVVLFSVVGLEDLSPCLYKSGLLASLWCQPKRSFSNDNGRQLYKHYHTSQFVAECDGQSSCNVD